MFGKVKQVAAWAMSLSGHRVDLWLGRCPGVRWALQFDLQILTCRASGHGWARAARQALSRLGGLKSDLNALKLGKRVGAAPQVKEQGGQVPGHKGVPAGVPQACCDQVKSPCDQSAVVAALRCMPTQQEDSLPLHDPAADGYLGCRTCQQSLA